MRAVIPILLCIAFVGCDKPADVPATGTTVVSSVTKPVAVPPAGVKFDPPIKPQQLPDGAWYCDMGTVHWAQMDKGVKCPECGMMLKQHGAAPAGGGHEHPQ